LEVSVGRMVGEEVGKVDGGLLGIAVDGFIVGDNVGIAVGSSVEIICLTQITPCFPDIPFPLQWHP